MSTRVEPVRRGPGGADGFTLVEVIVALTIFGIVAIAALPLLLLGLKAGARAEVQTLAKDLSQLRLERIRNLPYQVDRQNGPFVDLLDRYYTDATGAALGSVDEPACTGRYLANAAGPVGAPTGPAYRLTCATLPEAVGFSQVVYAQFLVRTTQAVTPPALYNSQTTGKDSAPSALLGVTVLTDWVRAGQSGRLRTYTEIADARGNGALIATQAQTVALRVSSNFVDDAGTPAQSRNLVAEVGVVKADGSLTLGSVASAQTIGVSLDHVGANNTLIEKKTASVASTSAPTLGNPSGLPAEVGENGVGAGSVADLTYVGCGWGWVGKSAYGNVTATTTAGRPVVPSNNADDVTSASATTARSGLINSGSGCAGYAFGFRNWLTTPSYALGVSATKPLVFIDDSSGGSTLGTGLALGEAAVTGTDISASPRSASSVARAKVGTVHMLPTADRPGGLVTATLSSSSVTCKSGVPVAGTYSLLVTWPGGSTTVTYPGSTPPGLPNPGGINFIDGGAPRTLSQYLEWNVSPGVGEATSGAQSIDQVFQLTSPATVVGPGGLAVQLGSLSCSAADDR